MPKPQAKKSKSAKKAKPAAKPKLTAAAPAGAGIASAVTKTDVIASRAKLPSGWSIVKTSLRLVWRNRKVFTGITLIYTLLNLLLVRGFTGISDFSTLRGVMESGLGSIAGGLGGFVVLISSSAGTSTPAGGVYLILLTIMASLAVVWTVRQILAGSETIRVRDGFYQGMYPIIPVILILLVMFFQCLPLVFGSQLYVTFLANGLAATLPEQIFWGILSLSLAALSLYFLITSTIALYITALPDMTPLRALRTARGLVKYRRWTVLRKLLFLPFVLSLVGAVIIVPCIIFITPAAPWVFLALLMVELPLVNTYFYLLYRELLD